MAKTKTFEAYRHELKKPTWVTIPRDKGESYAKHLAKGNPIQIAWINDEDGSRKTHVIKNKENLAEVVA